jgi:hypothetical protein
MIFLKETLLILNVFLHRYYLYMTNSMEKSLWEADSHSASQEIPRLL